MLACVIYLMTNKPPKARVGKTVLSLSNAIVAVAEILTIGHEKHGGAWDGGRMSAEDCIEKCDDSMMRHFLEDGIDDGEGGTGMHHDVAVAANALIRLERRIRNDKET